jgi:hypothetical protein
VGYYDNGSTHRTDHTLVERWNGTAWSVVSSPNQGTSNNNLTGVGVVSATDVWVVGTYYTDTTSIAQTLVERWDGTAWSVVDSPNQGTSYNYLSGVGAVSANDVWAVGSYYNGSTNHTLVEHWDGSAWSVVDSPNQGTGYNYLGGVGVVSANDVWAVGSYYNGYPDPYQTLVEHWNGTAWSIVSSPNPGTSYDELFGVAANRASGSANDVWAVGYYSSGGVGRTLVERYTLQCP